MINYNAAWTGACTAAQAAANVWYAQALHRGPSFSLHNSDLSGRTSEVVGYMLDNCGNAYLAFKDRRSAHFKAFKKLGLLSPSGTLRPSYPLRGRQEHGLHVAACEAALQVLLSHGITGVQVYDYID